MDTSKIISLLGEQSEFLLGHTCKTIDKSLIHIPSPSVINSIWIGYERRCFLGLKSMICPSITWAYLLILISRRCWLCRAD